MFFKALFTVVLAILLNFVYISDVSANLCQNNRVKLQVLGSGGPELDDGRVSSGYLIWLDNKARIMIDSGSGTSINFGKAKAKFNDLAAILLTHLHVDHSADLAALIKGSYFTPRVKELMVLGPAGNQFMPSTSSFVQSFFGKQGAFRYLNDYLDPVPSSDYLIKAVDIALKPRKIITTSINSQINVQSIPVHHGPIAAVAWRVNVLGCSITFSGDMSNRYQTLAKLAKNSDLLVANNAILESAQGVAANLHMRPSTIGEIANKAKVKRLVLSHLMNRTNSKQQQSLLEIRKSYQGKASFAEDLAEYKVN